MAAEGDLRGAQRCNALSVVNDLTRRNQLSADDTFTAAALRPRDHCSHVATPSERHVHEPTEIVQVEMRKEWHPNWA